MKLITLASATLNQTPMDWSNIRKAIDIARTAKAHILCLDAFLDNKPSAYY